MEFFSLLFCSSTYGSVNVLLDKISVSLWNIIWFVYGVKLSTVAKTVPEKKKLLDLMRYVSAGILQMQCSHVHFGPHIKLHTKYSVVCVWKRLWKSYTFNRSIYEFCAVRSINKNKKFASHVEDSELKCECWIYNSWERQKSGRVCCVGWQHRLTFHVYIISLIVLNRIKSILRHGAFHNKPGSDQI